MNDASVKGAAILPVNESSYPIQRKSLFANNKSVTFYSDFARDWFTLTISIILNFAFCIVGLIDEKLCSSAQKDLLTINDCS